MAGDVFDHLAAIELPLPDPHDVERAEEFEAARDEVLRLRKERARDEREWWHERWNQTGGEEDPVLDAIDQARQAMLDAEQHLRLLLAYGYEFVRPRGHTLAQLAAHAGMSISGVRTAYEMDEEGRAVAERTGLQPRRGPLPPLVGADHDDERE